MSHQNSTPEKGSWEEKNRDTSYPGGLTVADAVVAGDHTPEGVSFREYLHYAAIQRDDEAKRPEPTISENGLKALMMRVPPPELTEEEKGPLSDLEVQKVNAQRVLRQAGWSSVFFLITTDILGPFNAPYAISQNGYVPGVLLYVVFGAAAAYTGIVLSWLYCKLDSDRYPIRTFGDLAHRLFGKTARHFMSFLQSLQLIINVGTICLSNGQSLSQIAKGNLCFSVCIVIWTAVGMVMGQIRTLSRYTIIANWAVWLNLTLIFITMGVVSSTPVNTEAAVAAYGPEIASGPVVTKAISDGPLYAKVNGFMNMVFAYGGAMVFMEFMAEMRRPWDFWKGMASAQALIFCVYLMFGVFVYHYQGQYTLGLAYQGINSYAWQTVGNVFALITGIIAAVLYGNIGIKVAYIYIVEDWFKGPPLTSKKGIKIWFVLCCTYWALAFVVGSAIPQVQTISSLVAAICILQFSYSFPFLFLSCYLGIEDATKDEPFTPGVAVQKIDTWKDASRWKRAIVGEGVATKRFFFKLVNFILALACFSTAALGMYGAGKSIKVTFENGAATSFGCTPPV